MKKYETEHDEKIITLATAVMTDDADEEEWGMVLYGVCVFKKEKIIYKRKDIYYSKKVIERLTTVSDIKSDNGFDFICTEESFKEGLSKYLNTINHNIDELEIFMFEITPLAGTLTMQTRSVIIDMNIKSL